MSIERRYSQMPALQRSAMYIRLIGLICSNYAIMTKMSTYAHPSGKL